MPTPGSAQSTIVVGCECGITSTGDVVRLGYGKSQGEELAVRDLRLV